MRSTKMTRGRALAAATVLSLLGACGGGGGSSGTGGGTAVALAITADNAPAVARAAVTGINAGQLAGSTGGGLVAGSANVAGLALAHRAQALAVNAAQRTAASVTLTCSVSGSISANVTDLNGDGKLDLAGEGASITAYQCDEGTGNVINGSFSLQLTRYVDSGNFSLAMNFAGLSDTDAAQGLTETINGNLSIGVASGSQYTVASDSFSATDVTAAGTRAVSVQGFAASITDGGSQISETLSGTFASSEFGGSSVQISTPVPLVQLTGDSFPSQGEVLVTGSAGSALKIDVLNNTQAQLSLDANGDGSFESVTTVGWSSIT